MSTPTSTSSDVAGRATAFAHRAEAWVKEFDAAIDQGVRGMYVNFLDDAGIDGVHDAYPGATSERLAQIKAEYDPDNVFH